MTSILASKQEIVMIDFLLLSWEQPTMLHESRASDAVVYGGVAEIRRFLMFAPAPKQYGFFPTTHQTQTVDFVRDFPNPVGRLTNTTVFFSTNCTMASIW